MEEVEELLLQYLLLLTTVIKLMIPYEISNETHTYSIDNRRAHEETKRIVDSSTIICKNQIRMGPETFNMLLDMIRSQNLLRDTKHVSVEQQLVMYLFTLAHNVKNRVLSHTFGRSGETISRYLNQTLKAILSLHKILIAPLPTVTPIWITSNNRFAGYFQDCIGAIDGTHIPAHVPLDLQKRFRDRKGNLSQNVLAACDFDLRFTYVLSGWEGSVSDSRMLNDALTSANPIKVPIGKYYLVDAGFANRKGFLSPYRNVRYHLKEWRRSNFQPQNAKELYNLRHSSLRNVIERCFGLLKCRFKILKSAPEYPIPTQVNIVNICCLLHNLMLQSECITDEELHTLEEEDSIDTSTTRDNHVDEEVITESDIEWNRFRDNLAYRMWIDYCNEQQI